MDKKLFSLLIAPSLLVAWDSASAYENKEYITDSRDQSQDQRSFQGSDSKGFQGNQGRGGNWNSPRQPEMQQPQMQPQMRQSQSQQYNQEYRDMKPSGYGSDRTP